MGIILGILAVFGVLMIFSLCRVSSMCSRMEEKEDMDDNQ